MTPQEIFTVVQSQFPQVQEIPYPPAPSHLPAHEAKPYRDPHLYLSCTVQDWPKLSKFLREDKNLDFDFLTFVTAVDIQKPPQNGVARMDVVYHLYSFSKKHKCVVKISVPRENPVITSCASHWMAADWQEREVYDMFGIQFQCHPNLKRILMWEGFPGWPLRKDYVHIPDRYDD